MDNSITLDVDKAVDNTSSQTETQQQAQERLFRQSELNEIVGRAKHEAVESYKRQHNQYGNKAVENNNNPSDNNVSEDYIRKLTTDEIARQRDQWAKEAQEKADAEMAHRIVSSYKEKISAGKEKYTDFENVINNVDMRYYPNVVQLLAEYVDNSHDVIYDLAKNRTKLYQLESTCAHNPQDAIYEIKRLSESIKANENNSKIKHPNSPLSQIRPSNTGTDSGQTLSVRDYKKMYKV